mgnify:CR=1 FL=1
MTLSISDMEKITYLEQNVKDLQHQVTESYKRIKDLTGTLERSEEHTSELQSQSTISYAVFCLKKKKKRKDYLTSANLNTRTKKGKYQHTKPQYKYTNDII